MRTVSLKRAQREYRLTEKGRRSRVNATRRRQWQRQGIEMTDELYDRMLLAQGGVCFICRRPPKTRRLAVDHDHVTKEVRGLLCFRCNHGLIGRRRDPEIFRRAADYLEGRYVELGQGLPRQPMYALPIV